VGKKLGRRRKAVNCKGRGGPGARQGTIRRGEYSYFGKKTAVGKKIGKKNMGQINGSKGNPGTLSYDKGGGERKRETDLNESQGGQTNKHGPGRAKEPKDKKKQATQLGGRSTSNKTDD